MYIGKRQYISDTIDISERYFSISEKDEMAAVLLEEKGLYNQAAYFYIQSMEKQVKAHIAQKVNVINSYFAEEMRKTMGHSLDESLKLLFKIYSGNDETLFTHLFQQLTHQVFQNVKFTALHNKVRYPTYNSRYQNYTELILSANDCYELRKMLSLLKQYLDSLGRIK